MPYKHLVTEDKLEEIIEDAENSDRDVNPDGIRDMYFTPDEALGRTIKLHLHWGHTFCEIAAINMGDETVTLSELFTDREFTVSTDDSFDIPFIGAEYTVEWIEAKVNGEWERVSDYSAPDDPMGPYVKRGEEYDTIRVVSKTYEYGSDKYSSWPIRIDRQTNEPEIVPDREDLQNPEVLDRVLDSIALPDDFDLGGLEIGTVYTDEHIVETDDGEYEREYEVVWWTIKSQFQPSNHRRVSPITALDRSPA